MDNGQKRKLLTLVYKTISFFSVIAIICTLYLCVDKTVTKSNNVLWLDATLIALSCLILIFILSDFIATKKLYNKYYIAMLYYIFFILSFLSLIALGIYCYKVQIDISLYFSYILPLGLIFATQIVLIVNFVLGLIISKLYRNNTITIDSVSDTPNFDDEVLLKKKLDELNRKLSIKKIQDEINRVEKELDE